MAMNLSSYEDSEDDYIDMEVGTYINFFQQSTSSSPPNPREFEFQMSSNSLDKDMAASPADELFYQGKLLPLHLPPRLQMVEKILESRSFSCYGQKTVVFDETAVSTPTTTSPLFQSCDISPSESFRSSTGLYEEERIANQYSIDRSEFVTEKPKNSVASKTKYSSLSLQLKASKAYLKRLFIKSGCSKDSSAAEFRNTQEGSVLKTSRSSTNEYKKVAKRTPFGQIPKGKGTISDIDRFGKKDREYGGSHRRSFSGVITRHLTTKSSSSFSSSSVSSSSSSSSSNSFGFDHLPFFKTSNSSGSDLEVSIKGAIAHCKQSQQILRSSTSLNEINYSVEPASKHEN